MKITDVEKIILINQYKILAQLYPEDKAICETNIEILESGYTSQYTELYYMGTPTISEKQCENLKITDIEKIILVNQYKILSKLYPEDKETYKTNIEILESGLTSRYEELFYIDTEEMPEAQCTEVLDILDMYRLLSFGVEDLDNANDADFKRKAIFFPGFDGNYELKYLSYTKFLLHKRKLFQELRHSGEFPDYNSHSPMLPTYRSMLDKLKNYGNSIQKLSKMQIDELLKIAPFSLVNK